VKRVLADIDTHHSDCGVELLGHGVLPLLIGPRQLCLLAGQEARPDHSISVVCSETASHYG
jgi:hypothetical protein